MSSCYDVDTAVIERATAEFGRLDTNLADLGPADFAAYAKKHRAQLRKLVEIYLDAVSCFFDVMGAIAKRQLALERQVASQKQRTRPTVDRAYLEGFLPLYVRASERSIRHVRDLFTVSFTNAPVLPAICVSHIVESGALSEIDWFTNSVRTANTPAQVQEHGQTGKEIVDSIKGSLKSYAEKFIPESRGARFAEWTVKKTLGLKVTITKDSIDEGFRLMNEVLGMVFRGPGAA